MTIQEQIWNTSKSWSKANIGFANHKIALLNFQEDKEYLRISSISEENMESEKNNVEGW